MLPDQLGRVPGTASLAPEVSDLLRRLAALHGATVTVEDDDGREIARYGDGPAQAIGVTAAAHRPGLVVRVLLPSMAGPAAAELADYAAEVLGQVSAVRGDLDLLTDELLERYEEVTLLHEVSQDLGVVVDVGRAAEAALARTLKAVPARFGHVFVRDADGHVDAVASAGESSRAAAPDGIVPVLAEATLRGGASTLVHAGQTVPGTSVRAVEPLLAVPITLEGVTTTGALGVLVLVGHSLRQRFSAGEAQLAGTVARQLAVGLENGRLVSALREKERLEGELELAAAIQARLLPASAPPVHGARLRAACLPAEHVGGDYYDFAVCGERGAVATVVADVTGHGVGPGLIMAMTRSVLRAELATTSNLPAALTATNTTMWDDLLATGLFITVFCLSFEPSTRQVRFVNGGHHPALLRHPDGRVEELDSDGMPIGLLPDPGYEEGRAELAPGSVVLVFSDGVVETRAPGGELFGTARLVDLLAEHGGKPDVIDRLLAALAGHRAGAAQQDDVTVVELRVDPPDPADAATWAPS